MSKLYGHNPMQARIASIGISARLGPKGALKVAENIAKTGVGSAPLNRSQRRFEYKQARKQK